MNRAPGMKGIRKQSQSLHFLAYSLCVCFAGYTPLYIYHILVFSLEKKKSLAVSLHWASDLPECGVYLCFVASRSCHKCLLSVQTDQVSREKTDETHIVLVILLAPPSKEVASAAGSVLCHLGCIT